MSCPCSCSSLVVSSDLQKEWGMFVDDGEEIQKVRLSLTFSHSCIFTPAASSSLQAWTIDHPTRHAGSGTGKQSQEMGAMVIPLRRTCIGPGQRASVRGLAGCILRVALDVYRRLRDVSSWVVGSFSACFVYCGGVTRAYNVGRSMHVCLSSSRLLVCYSERYTFVPRQGLEDRQVLFLST